MSDKFLRSKDFVGKDVIDSKAMKVGKVKDMAFDIGGEMAVVVETSEASDKIISTDLIAFVGDVILLKPEDAPKQDNIPPQAPTPARPPVVEVMCPA